MKIRSVIRTRNDGAVVYREFHAPSRSKYKKPHQGKRECERRRIGGFFTLRRTNMGERV